MKIWGYRFPSVSRFKMVKKPVKRIHKDFPLLLAFNILGGILIFYCYMIGYLHTIIAADTTGFMMYLIFGVATISILLGLHRSYFFMNQMKRLNKDQPLHFPIKLDSVDPRGVLELRISSLLNYPQVTPKLLTGLGLLGTVGGILIMMSSMGGGVIGDASAAKGAMSHILAGFALALYTTLVGLFFSLWCQCINAVLHTQSDRLIASILHKMDITK